MGSTQSTWGVKTTQLQDIAGCQYSQHYLLNRAIYISTMDLSQITKEGEVLILTESNFQSVIDSCEFVLVDFYASWCPPCQDLAPEYVKAAANLAAKGSNIKLAKVDAEEEQGLSEKYEIEGFPTLKYFRSGKCIEYGGGRTEESIVNWVEKKAGPSAVSLNSVEETSAFVEGKDVVVIGFFPDQTTDAAKAFLATADTIDEFQFGVTSSEDIASKYKVEGEAVLLLKTFDEGRAVLSEEITEKTVNTFVTVESLPLVLEFSQNIARKMFTGEIKSHLMAFLSKKSDNYTADINVLQPIAKENKGKMLVVVVNTDDDDHSRFCNMLGITKAELPTLRAIKLGDEDMEQYKHENTTIETENLKIFVTKFLAGELKQHLKSEDLPEDWDKKGTKVLVGKNFTEVAMDTEKDVLVDFYADWCPPCQTLAPIIEELGEKFANHPKVIIAKIDACANEVEEVKIRSYPTIKLIKSGTNEIVDYDNARTVEGFVNFIKEQTGQSPLKE